MSSKIILVSLLSCFIFFTGCKAPACSTLSWGEISQVEENGAELKFSAGKKCGNFNDYWDADIESIISKIQKMKFVKNETCQIPDPESGEGVEFECPEFVPETIEFNEVVGCKFDTPPGEETLCAAGPVEVYFQSDIYFENVMWRFDPRNPQFCSIDEVLSEVLITERENIIMTGKFLDESLDKVTIRFNWTEPINGVETKKEMSLEYSVEVKE